MSDYDQHREKLLRVQAAIEPRVTFLTGRRECTLDGRTYDVWNEALTRPAANAGYSDYDFPDQLGTLLVTALGALDVGASHERPPASEILRVFISHGGRTRARDQIERFIRFLGAEPVIVEDQPNLGASVNEKVRREVQLSHYAVVLGTAERGAQQDNKTLPRSNIVDELARLQELLGPDHVLVVLETGVEVPSNTAEFVRGRFTQECIEEVQAQLVNELRGLGPLTMRATLIDAPPGPADRVAPSIRLGHDPAIVGGPTAGDRCSRSARFRGADEHDGV